jgi:hypothetical protein
MSSRGEAATLTARHADLERLAKMLPENLVQETRIWTLAVQITQVVASRVVAVSLYYDERFRVHPNQKNLRNLCNLRIGKEIC